jgi:O-antigen ligase
MLFLTAAAFSLLSPGVTLGSVRVYVEGFIVPALFAWYVISFFSIHDRLRKLHVLTALMCLYCAPIGIAEIVLGEDLMPLKDSGSFYAGTGIGEILRVNGPFQSNNSYALIGLVALFLLFFLRQAIGTEMPRWQRLLHFFGCLAAVVISLLPMFRSVLLSLVAILFLHLWSTRSWQKRVIFMVVLGVVCCSFLVLNAVMPDLYEERVTSLDNVTARFAQQEQNIDMFLGHPILGVGIGNFLNVVKPVTKYSSLNPHGIDPLDAPHNNLAAVLVETGIVGFTCYFLAQIFLVAAFWRFRRSAVVSARISWVFFLYVYLCYWINGMTLTSGHYGDLNIWYLFVLAVIYKYGIEEERKHPREIAYAS